MELTEAYNTREGQAIKFYANLDNTSNAGSLTLGKVIRHLNDENIPMVEVESNNKLFLMHPLRIVQIQGE